MAAIFDKIQTPLAFAFVLGILIFIHELGHFLVARWYGVRVLTFSLGFGPKLLKIRRGDTEYAISAIPLGGYVKLAGENVQDTPTGAPDEFLSKSKWIRFQVYLAGPIMNLMLAWLLLAGVMTRAAEVPAYPTQPPVIGRILPDSPAARAGIQPGDRIVAVNGRPTPDWDALDIQVVPKANREIELAIDRNGQPLMIRVTPASVGKFELGTLGIGPVERPQFTLLQPDRPASRAGFQPYDVILDVDDQKLDQPQIIKKIAQSAGQSMTFTVLRGERTLDVPVTPEGSEGSARIGATISTIEVRRVDLNLFQALKLSAVRNWEQTKLIGGMLRDLVRREQPMKQLMGPVAIAQLSGATARLGWLPLLEFMAMISLNLGLLNLMPVPVLDGGQIAILLVEGLFRRELSVRVKERILLAGAALIILLMVTVIYNDVARLFR
jgi:regulator of sigma E protease